MICPECHAEYREGFAVCADCDVKLVPCNTSASANGDDDPYCAFWEGEDTRIFAEICTVLDESGIVYRALRHDSQVFRLNPYGKMKIGVPFSQYEKAEVAVVEAFGGTAESKNLLWPTEESSPAYANLTRLPFEEKWRDEGSPGHFAEQDSEDDEYSEAPENQPDEQLAEDPPGNMYCPLCGAEYRAGFANCNECQVALVATRAEARVSRARLWRGEHQRELDQILAALDAQQIPPHFKELVNAISRIKVMGIPLGPNRAAFEYEVWVFKKNLANARAAMNAVLPPELDD